MSAVTLAAGIGTVRSNATQMPPGAGQNIVINQPGLRPGQPGAQITVPLQTLQNLRPGQGIPTGQAGHLLVKTETGQYQILRVGTTLPSLASSTPSGVMSHPTSMSLRPTMSPSISTANSSTGISLPQRPVGPIVSSSQSIPAVTRPTVASTVATQGSAVAAAAGGAGGGMGTQMTPDTAKLKCKNFLATLLRLAGEQPAVVAANVRDLIQGLIDGHVEPEVFTTKLQKELNSSPQPCLVPFLKKSLPYLQQSLLNGELSIDGVRPPPLQSPAGQALQHQQRTLQQQQQQQQLQQQQQAVKVQVLGSPSVQLPQRPSMMMPPVRTMSAGVRQPVGPSTVSTSISNSPAVQAVISQLRPTANLGTANIRDQCYKNFSVIIDVSAQYTSVFRLQAFPPYSIISSLDQTLA
jgi:transcription initiation factor TFIID subunit 4